MAQMKRSSAEGEIRTAAERVLKRLKTPERIPADHRPRIVKNLGNLITDRFPEKPTTAWNRMVEKAGLASDAGRRQRYAWFASECGPDPDGWAPHDALAAHTDKFWRLVEALVDISLRPGAHRDLEFHDAILRLVKGTNFDPAGDGNVRSRGEILAGFLECMDSVRTTVLGHVNLDRYFEDIRRQPIYWQDECDQTGSFCWSPNRTSLTFSEQLGHGPIGGQDLFPGFGIGDGGGAAALPNVRLGWLYLPPTMDGEGAEPRWVTYPLHLVLGPDLTGRTIIGAYLDELSFDYVPLEANLQPTLREREFEYLSIHDSYWPLSAPEVLDLMTRRFERDRWPEFEAMPWFEPEFPLLSDVGAPLPLQSIGGMIQRNLRAAPADQRIDLLLRADAEAKVRAVHTFLEREDREFERAIRARIIDAGKVGDKE